MSSTCGRRTNDKHEAHDPSKLVRLDSDAGSVPLRLFSFKPLQPAMRQNAPRTFETHPTRRKQGTHMNVTLPSESQPTPKKTQ